MEHCDNNTNQNTNGQSPDSISQCSCPGLAVFMRGDKMTIEERIISTVKYCREHTWQKTLELLHHQYRTRIITARQFNRIITICKAKRLHINY